MTVTNDLANDSDYNALGDQTGDTDRTDALSDSLAIRYINTVDGADQEVS